MIPYGIILAIGIAITLLAMAIFYMEIKYAKNIKRIEERLDEIGMKAIDEEG